MSRSLSFLLLVLAACKDTADPDELNENEVITSVVLTLAGGGQTQEARWADPENDGSPTIDDLTLSDAVDYTLSVQFLNELEDPAEDITLEVDEESDQHQVFFTGSAVGTVLEVTYDDTDANGLPVGLDTTIGTLAVGTGDLVVTLRHMPPEGDTAVKRDGLAEVAATEGIAALPGDSDVDVTFPVTVGE